MISSLRLPAFPVRAAVGLASPLLVASSLRISEQRRRTDLAARLLRAPLGTRVRRVSLAGVPAERVSRRGTDEGGALLYLHGGGYCIGSPASHRALAARLAGSVGVPAYVPAYRLAPEHPYPAAIDDAIAAYGALLESAIMPERILIAGDSAGGGLALALAIELRDRQMPLPAAVAMICPWLDLVPDCEGTRPRSNGDALLSPDTLAVWARAYADGAGAREPLVSPLRADLDGLPPLILHSSNEDVLFEDSERLADRVVRLEHRRIEGLWHAPHLLAGILAGADTAVDQLGAALKRRLRMAPPSVAVVGAGMSGLCMGDLLSRAGFDDFTIYEKADEVGGTWRENRYPGLTCDVPSRYYSYSFSPNPSWSSAFSPGPEIQRYFVEMSERRGLRSHIEFGAEIVAARWDGARWKLKTRDGEAREADVLVTATGVLHHPKIPSIAGSETFTGEAFHSARWNDAVELRGQRVAVIGTGSTGVQLTVAGARVAERLLLFQRTAQWVLPLPNHSYSEATRSVLRRVPVLNRVTYRAYQTAFEVLAQAVTAPGWQRTLIAGLCRANLRFAVRDPELRARLTPDYEPMCKRLVMSASFYPAVQRENVELVTAGIDHIEPAGIVTDDGVLHELDVIVYATGFDAHAYMRPMAITGADGLTLDQAWADGPRAYRTIAMPGFPNLFTLMGPHSPVGNFSLIAIAETQAGYVVQWLERMRRTGLRPVMPTPEATDEFNAELKSSFPGTVWVTGCQSWYLDKDGLPEVWPWTAARHREMLAEPEPSHFRIG